MPAKWKARENQSAPHILEALFNSITPDGDSGFSSQSMEIHQKLHALEAMIDFPGPPGAVNAREIIVRSVGKACNKEALSAESFMECVNYEIKKALSRPEKSYRILTSVSISPDAASRQYAVNGVRISGCTKGAYPQIYKSRLVALNQPHVRALGIKDDSGYHRLILGVKAKSPLAAMSAAIESLDILRACWCIYANPSLSIGSHEWGPINTVRLGAFHTVHDDNGELAHDDPWYEPGFVPAKNFSPRPLDSDSCFSKNVSRLLKRLKSRKLPKDFRKRIISSLLLYVRALDEPNPGTAFMGAWIALERLCLASQNEGQDQIVERCSVLFKDDRMFHRSMLVHLRERRNEYAHDGMIPSNAKLLCYLVQSYIKPMLRYLFFAANHFNSVEASLKLLSLEPDSRLIAEEIAARKLFIKHLCK
jgi:hypothetical protein